MNIYLTLELVNPQSLTKILRREFSFFNYYSDGEWKTKSVLVSKNNTHQNQTEKTKFRSYPTPISLQIKKEPNND